MKYQKLIIVFSLLLLVIWYLSLRKGIRLLDTQDEMQSEVSRYISIGSSVSDGRRILEDSGFECKEYKNDVFAIEKRDRNGQLLSTTEIEGDFVLCESDRSYILAKQIWRVALLDKNGKVEMIHSVVHWWNL